MRNLSIRKLSSQLLGLVTRHSPPESRMWGQAMLREMEFVESDKDLLWWAIGGTTAICSYSVKLRLRTGIQEIVKGIHRGESKRAIEGILSGIAIAGTVLGFCVLGYWGLVRFYGWQPRWERFADAILIFVVPEAAYFFAISRLWSQRKSAAWGVLIAAAILFTHVVVHHASHG